MGCWSLGKGGLVLVGGNTAWQGVEAPPRVCNLLIANTWASPLPPRMPDEGCVHPTPGVLVFVKEAWVSYTRVRGQLLQVGNNSICLRFVFLHFLQHSWGGPLKSLSLSPLYPCQLLTSLLSFEKARKQREEKKFTLQ